MSIKLMSWAFHDSPADLSPAQVLVLVALADASDDDGHVRYLAESARSQDALAAKTRMSRRTLQRALDVLEERELVRRVKGGTIFEPLEYHITVRQNDATMVRHPDALRGVTMTQRTSIDGIDGGTRAKRSPKGKHPLPADWKPSTVAREYCAKNGIDVELEAETFRAHAEANAREVVVWDAAFRQWLLKARPSQTSTQNDWAVGDEWMGLAR
jgi:hypothetical protein